MATLRPWAVLRFDHATYALTVLRVRRSLKGPTNEAELLARETACTGPAAEFPARVAAMSAALADFSRDVTAALRDTRWR
jgi:hypothetical protein